MRVHKSIYLAGAMRGRPQWNFPAFDEALARWEFAGWTVYSPAAVDRALGFDEYDDRQEVDIDFVNRALRLDLILLESADAIALLPGWEESTGATVELAFAQFHRLKVFDAVSMKEIHPVKHPWFE